MAYIRKSDGSRVRVRAEEVWGPTKTPTQLAEEARASIQPVTRMQFSIALAVQGIVTAEEAKDFAGGTALPALAKLAIQESGLSETEKMAAEIRALGASEVRRTNPLVLMLQRAVPMTDEQADALFAAAAAIE